MVTTTEQELDWEQDADVLEARQHLKDMTAIHEQKERERQLIWECKFSDDPFSRARHRAEWPDADQGAALAEAHWVKAKQRLARAEQRAKEQATPLWDDRFRARWLAIEQILNGPLMAALTDWEILAREASVKGLVTPVQLPANLTTETLPIWITWVRGQLSLDR